MGYFTAPGTVINPSSFHYFGGSIGGPVLIPKLFDGRKHRLYFFTDWEDTLTNAVDTVNTDVPTMAERGGDFSGPSPQGRSLQPSTIPRRRPSSQAMARSAARPSRERLAYYSPKSRLDPVGLNIAAFFPQPNCSLNNNNYCVNPIAHSSYLYNASRIDFNASDYDHIWAKFSRDGPTEFAQAVNNIPNAANPSAFNGWTDDLPTGDLLEPYLLARASPTKPVSAMSREERLRFSVAGRRRQFHRIAGRSTHPSSFPKVSTSAIRQLRRR